MNANTDIDSAARDYGNKIFDGIENAGTPSIFTAKGVYATLMDWAMKDENFKVQLFRFVDVLPTLQSSGEITRHLKEYLDNDEVNLNPALRTALKASSLAGGLLGGGIKSQVSGMARMFMLGCDEREIVSILTRLHEQDAAFTVDVLGESVVSEKEADEYANRYIRLIEMLAHETAKWKGTCKSNLSPRAKVPCLNVSIKLSAFYSQIHATDPNTAIANLSQRLRPVLRRASQLGAFVCVDMESYAMKNLTLHLFKTIFSEAEFSTGPECGIAMQTYLKDCEADLRDLVNWARARRRHVTVRLVKGAYWDYETVTARQKGWPVPVWETKPETDACYERSTDFLLQNNDTVGAAFASHNVRSLAYVLAQTQQLGLDSRQIEFQVLYGMADAIRASLLGLGQRVRVYCPVGELLPGMAYLVRRLLENTSNEGFLAQKFAKGAERNALLRKPTEIVFEGNAARLVPAPSSTVNLAGFHNEPPTDFTLAAEREKMPAALSQWRGKFGRKYPLIIDNTPVETNDWFPSLNPANQNEVVGYAAMASAANANTALAAARSAQPKWVRVPADERAKLMEKLADLIRRDKTTLSALMVFEAGKNWTEADADVIEAVDFCNFYAAAMRPLAKPAKLQIVAGETNVQHWWPRGVGAVISPWNFPLAILCGMACAAVVGGNTVLLKPSNNTPVLASEFMRLCVEAGFPPGVFNLLTGRGSEVGERLITSPHIDFIAFTGSVEVGLHIWETAGRTTPGQPNLKKVVCEMGGKNCLIVDSDADLDEAVLSILNSAFGFLGQKCSALSRLIVLEDNCAKLIKRLLAACESLRVGPATEPGAIISPVIDRAAQTRILAVIEKGKTEAKLAWQGTVPDDSNACWVPPTIFTDVPPTSTLFRDEIFGPVLSITKAKTFDQAVALANDCAFALTGGLYSRSPVNIERAKADLVCGNLYINRGITGAIVGRQPFGGFKMSGGGTKAGGLEYIQQFLVPRVITENCLRRGFVPAED